MASSPPKVIVSNLQTSTIYNHTKQSQDNDEDENPWFGGLFDGFDDDLEHVTPQHPPKDKDDDKKNDDDTKQQDHMVYFFYVHLRQK